MRGLALGIALLLTVVSAASALLIVVPSPTQQTAFLAVAVAEKSYVVVLLAAVGAALAWLARDAAGPLWIGLAWMLAAVAATLSLVPPVQASRLAKRRGVELSWSRYLGSRFDVARARPDQTLVYAQPDGQALALDVYRPAGAPPHAVPAVIIVHGGGWSSGDKGEAPLTSAWLASRGFAVFDVQYRLAPQPSWRIPLADVKCAVAWVKRRSREAGVVVDPARITLLGRSAGGHLALLAGYTAADPELPPSCEGGDTSVAGVIALYAPTDLVWGYANPTNPRVYDSSGKLRTFLGGTPDTAPDAYQKASITNRVTAQAPRTLLVHGGHDQFVGKTHVDLLVPKLEAAGVGHDVLLVPYGHHGLDYVSGGLAGQLFEAAVLSFVQK
jgi:acetyl esterase/lipase